MLMPLSYRDVYDRWQRSKAFGDSRNIDQFSTDLDTLASMGRKPGFKAGDFSRPVKSAGWWTRASTTADEKFFEPLARATGLEALGGGVGKIFGAEQAGKEVARGLPRMLAQTAPLAAAEVFSAGAATPFVAPAALATTGALFAGQTYADTGSAGQAVLSGVTAAALPAIGRFSGNLAAKAFGAPIAKRVARAVGGSVGIYGAQLAQEELGTGEVHPLDPHLLMQQIPFTVLDLYGAIKPPKVKPTEPKVTEPEEIPYRPPPTSPEHAAAMGEVLDHLGGILSSDISTKEEKQNALELMQQVSLDPKAVSKVQLPKQPTLPKQETPWGGWEESVQKLISDAQKPPESVKEINDRLEKVTAAALQYPNGRRVEATTHDQALLDAANKGLEGEPEKGWVTNQGNFINDEQAKWLKGAEDVDQEEVIKKTPGNAKQKVTAAVEATTNAKKERAFIEKKVEERGLGKATLIRNKATGKTGFPSEADALLAMTEHRRANPEDEDNFKYRVAKQGKGYVVRRTPIQVSYEGKEGTSLENVLHDEPQVVKPATDIEDMPQDIYKRYLNGVHALRGNVGAARTFFGVETDSEAITLTHQFETIMWAEKNKKGFKEVNALLPKNIKFKNEEEYEQVHQLGLEAIGKVQALRQFDMGSFELTDPSWSNKMRDLWFKNNTHVKNILDWYVGHKDTPEPMKQLVQAMMRAHPPEDVKLTILPEEGMYYNGMGTINADHLPRNEFVAHLWAQQMLGHEYFHHVARQVFNRTDPAAMRFKAESTNILKALQNSPELPAKIRGAFGKAREWYREFTISGDNALMDKRITEAIGQDLANEYYHVFYGLLSEPEMMAMAFSSPKMTELMAKTKMPAKPTTVLQHFSQVWNTLFGGKKENDTALSQFLTAYDNYLSGPKVPSLQSFLRPQLSAGQGFLYGLAPYDPTTNILGGKHVLPKGGVIPETTLKTIGSIGKPLSDGEIQLYKQIVPEAFTEKGVSVPKLVTGLKEKGPTIEVKKLGAVDKAGNNRSEQILHQLETAGYSVYDDNGAILQDKDGQDVDWNKNPPPKEIEDLFNELKSEGWEQFWSGGGGGTFKFVAPKLEDQLPGYVEGLVRLPFTPARKEQEGWARRRGLEEDPFSDVSQEDIARHDREVGVRYRGSHFGSADENVLSFYRGYEETVGGEKAFHVIEVQSDWAQKIRRRGIIERGGRFWPEGFVGEVFGYATREEAEAAKTGFLKGEPDHPLLQAYEGLALKAAIQHAKEIGATKIILSDAETAMMTEGHDRVPNNPQIYQGTPEQVRQYIQDNNIPREGYTIARQTDAQGRPINVVKLIRDVPKVPQEKGMRLHYDQTLPSALEKITGEKGQMVDLGEHKNVSDWDAGHESPQATTRGSPVFKDAQGNPKTQITGRMYDLTKASAEHTLFEPKIPFAALSRTYSPQDYIRDSLLTKGARSEALMSRLRSIQDFYNLGSIDNLIKGFQREMDAGVLPATYSGGTLNEHVTNALTYGTSKDVFQYTMGLLAESEVPVHEDLWHQLQTDVTITKDLYQAIRKGHIRGEVPPHIVQNIKDAQGKLSRMQDALQKQGAALKRYVQLDNFNPEGYVRTISGRLSGQEPPAPPDKTPLHEEAQRDLGLRSATTKAGLERTGMGQRFSDWFARTMAMTQHAMQLIPGVKDAINHSFQLQGDSFARMEELNVVRYGTEEGERQKTIKIYKRLFKGNAQNPLATIANDIHRWFQTEEKAGRNPTMDKPFVKNKLSTLSPQDQGELLRYFDSTHGTSNHYRESTVAQQFVPRINNLDISHALMANEPGMRAKVATDLAGKLYGAVRLIQEPKTALLATEQLKGLSAQMRPETFAKAFQLAQDLQKDSDKFIEFMRTRSHYVTEQRLDGKHGLRMTTPEGDTYFQRFATRTDANNRRIALEREGYKFGEYVDPYQAGDPIAGIDKDYVQQVQQWTEQRLNRIKATYADKPDVVAALSEMSNIPAELESSKAAFGAVPGAGFPRRHFTPGREELNMVFNEYRGYMRFNNWMHHQLMRATMAVDLLEPELMSNPTSSKFVRQHYENMLAPDSRFARQLSEFTYNYKLAWNFGVNMLHFVQASNTGIAELIASTGSAGDSLKLMSGAAKAVYGRMLNRKWANPDHDWLDRYLTSRGSLGYATWEGDIGDRERNLTYDANTPPWLEPVNKIKNAARSWNSWFFRYNDRLGAIAAFDLARSQGKGLEEAAQFAQDSKNKWTYTGGKAQRPVGFWSIKTRAVPQLMSALQTYVHGWFSQLATNYIRGFGDPAVKMNAAERVAARKAFLYQMGFQAVLAGALGLPGVGQGMALVKQSTGVDVMAWLRQHSPDFFGEDETSGGFMTALALHGLPAATTQLGIPSVDVSGRHMPSVPYIGVSPYKGFDVAQFAGAAVSTPSDLIHGLMALAQGKAPTQAIPSFLRGPIELFGGGGDVRDQRGRTIAQATPYEKFVMAMGLKAPRIQDIKEVNAAAQEAEKRASQNKTKLVHQISDKYQKDPQGAKADLASYLKEHPEDDGQAVVNEIASHVADTTIPYDWRRHVNAGADVTGLGSREPSSEVTRRDLLYKVKNDFGLRQKLNPHADLEALEVDELMDADHTMTLARAKRQVKAMKVRSKQRRFSILE